jgi:mono/diheme cytochrome c family protein
VRYIHYLRQEGRYADLTAAVLPDGDSGMGDAFFGRRCRSCHATDGNLRGVASKYDASALRAQVLRPRGFTSPDAPPAPGRDEHRQLLEQYTEPDLANLVAFLERAAR